MTDQHKDIDHLVAMIRSEKDQLKHLSETAKDSRAPVKLDQQSVVYSNSNVILAQTRFCTTRGTGLRSRCFGSSHGVILKLA